MKVLRFYREIYRDNDLRVQGRRNLKGDLLLYAKNRLLQPAEALLQRRYRNDDPRVLFIVGAPRSGTTLLYQLIADHLAMGYVDNRVARYWMAPLWATRRSRARPVPRGVGGETRRATGLELTSDLGGTRGAAAPHEFGYFWQFRTGFEGSDAPTEAELDRVEWKAIRRALGALESWWRRPLVIKSLTYLDYNLERFARELPRALFLDVRRQPLWVAQSILEARVKRYGSRQAWWSIRPRDVERWRDAEPVEQVCHQVADVRRALDRQIADLRQRAHAVDYEALVEAPERTLEALRAFLNEGWGEAVPLVDAERLAGLELRSSNRPRLEPETLEALREGLAARGLPAVGGEVEG